MDGMSGEPHPVDMVGISNHFNGCGDFPGGWTGAGRQPYVRAVRIKDNIGIDEPVIAWLTISRRTAARLLFGLVALVAAGPFLLFPAGSSAQAEEVRLIAFGDSLVHGYGLPDGTSFPDQLQQALDGAGEKVTVVNAGNSGDTSKAGLARLDWALADRPEGIPVAMIVELGANDTLRGLPPEQTYANLDQILSKLSQGNVQVLLAGMLAPRNLGNDYADQFDAIYPDLADKHGVALYPFFLDGVALEPQLNQPDGIHPNAEGVAVIVDRIMPSVLELLAQTRENAKEDQGG